MTQISRLRAALNRQLNHTRAHRAADAQRAQLEIDLRSYRSKSDLAEMDAILSRHPESETHRVWHSMPPMVSSGSWARA